MSCNVMVHLMLLNKNVLVIIYFWKVYERRIL